MGARCWIWRIFYFFYKKVLLGILRLFRNLIEWIRERLDLKGWDISVELFLHIDIESNDCIIKIENIVNDNEEKGKISYNANSHNANSRDTRDSRDSSTLSIIDFSKKKNNTFQNI